MSHSSSANEATLWAAALGGDGSAFASLFDHHRDRVFRHALRLASSHHEAEDVLASAFLELWRKRRSVRLVNGSVLPWLLATTTNVGRNSSRSARRYKEFLGRLPRASDVIDVALVVEDRQISQSLRDALRELSAKDAGLFALVVLEGYPLAEAAEQLHMTESAAKSRLHRTRTRLRSVLPDPFQGGSND